MREPWGAGHSVFTKKRANEHDETAEGEITLLNSLLNDKIGKEFYSLISKLIEESVIRKDFFNILRQSYYFKGVIKPILRHTRNFPVSKFSLDDVYRLNTYKKFQAKHHYLKNSNYLLILCTDATH